MSVVRGERRGAYSLSLFFALHATKYLSNIFLKFRNTQAIKKIDSLIQSFLQNCFGNLLKYKTLFLPWSCKAKTLCLIGWKHRKVKSMCLRRRPWVMFIRIKVNLGNYVHAFIDNLAISSLTKSVISIIMWV